MRNLNDSTAIHLQKLANRYVRQDYQAAKAIGDIDTAGIYLGVAIDIQRALLEDARMIDPRSLEVIKRIRNLCMYLVRSDRLRNANAPVCEEAYKLALQALDLRPPHDLQTYFEAVIDSYELLGKIKNEED
jgi:hypothetical protein